MNFDVAAFAIWTSKLVRMAHRSRKCVLVQARHPLDGRIAQKKEGPVRAFLHDYVVFIFT